MVSARTWFVFCVALGLLTGCGSDGADGAPGADGDPGSSALVDVSDEPAGENCAGGGYRIDHGLDADGDGSLDDEEIAGAFYVCNGDDGEPGEDGDPGQTALANITDEPAGENCVNGGHRIDYGLDENGNGGLDDEEILGEYYACDGEDGEPGESGDPGRSSLASITDEPAGDNCASGGHRIDHGLDADGDGTLDAEEITGTIYICDGSDGEDGEDGENGEDAAEVLIETDDVYEAGFGCEGYEATSIGVDDGAGGGTAGDGILQEGEVRTVLRTCLPPDVDGDGYRNLNDVCPTVADPLQIDMDFNGVGDACSPPSGVVYYAITRGDSEVGSDLYTYDPVTNTAALIGATGHSLITIKVNPDDGELYGMTRSSDSGGCDDCLVRLNTVTGAASEVADLPDGPHPSMAFLSDGDLYTWNEDNDMFGRVDIEDEDYIELGESISSWAHGMCATAEDDILWINGDGHTYLIDPADGSRSDLGSLEDSADGIWDPPEGDYGLRGDCNPTSLFAIGVDVTYGDSAAHVVTARLYRGAAPQVLASVPSPVANFHYMAMSR